MMDFGILLSMMGEPPKPAGYYIKETFEGKTYYWRDSGMGYVTDRTNIRAFSIEQLKSNDLMCLLRAAKGKSTRYTLRLIPEFNPDKVNPPPTKD